MCLQLCIVVLQRTEQKCMLILIQVFKYMYVNSTFCLFLPGATGLVLLTPL